MRRIYHHDSILSDNFWQVMQRSLVTGADEDEGLCEEANPAEEQDEALGHQAPKEEGDIPM